MALMLTNEKLINKNKILIIINNTDNLGDSSKDQRPHKYMKDIGKRYRGQWGEIPVEHNRKPIERAFLQKKKSANLYYLENYLLILF